MRCFRVAAHQARAPALPRSCCHDTGVLAHNAHATRRLRLRSWPCRPQGVEQEGEFPGEIADPAPKTARKRAKADADAGVRTQDYVQEKYRRLKEELEKQETRFRYAPTRESNARCLAADQRSHPSFHSFMAHTAPNPFCPLHTRLCMHDGLVLWLRTHDGAYRRRKVPHMLPKTLHTSSRRLGEMWGHATSSWDLTSVVL